MIAFARSASMGVCAARYLAYDLSISFTPTIMDLPANLGPPDVTLVSADGQPFAVHKSHLLVASDLARDMSDLGASEEKACIQLSDDQLETGRVLTLVVPLFYNLPAPDLSTCDFQVLLAMFQFGEKWLMYRASDLATAELQRR